MCSIPGLPTPGSEVSFLITRVNLNLTCGFVELWVNMDDDRKHMSEKTSADLQVPQREFGGAEGKPGDLCLVCISHSWHRARIVSIQSETYNVFLIDQGQRHVATSEALAWGRGDSFLLPPETESCILANVLSLDRKWPEAATEFLMSLPGKKFNGLVQHVLMQDRTILLDIPTVSKSVCEFGVAKEIQVDEFKCLVLKYLHTSRGEATGALCTTQPAEHDQYFYPELLTDTFGSVTVTALTDPANMFCSLLIFSKAVKALSEQVHQHYAENSDFGEAQPQTCGDPCAARGTSGRWHRSLLKQHVETSDGAVEVLHVDEGKTELVRVGDVRPLLGRFLRMPVFTYLCSLRGIRDQSRVWTEDETEHLKSLLLNQTVVARFDHHNVLQDVYDVTLYASNAACINRCFLEKAGLAPPSEPEGALNVQNEPIPSLFLSSLGDDRCKDVKVDGLPEETWPSTKDQVANGRRDDVCASGTDDIRSKGSSQHPDPLMQNGHLPAGFLSEVQSSWDDHVLTAGSSVGVHVSCIESLQKFWCQTTENQEPLRLLMQDLQHHYASAPPQPLVESVCAARNPDDNMWYRARIIASHHSPMVGVRLIDYGQTVATPQRDVRPIDPVFLRLKAQAFPCCLFPLKNPTDPTTVAGSDAALTEFRRFVELGASSNTGLKCIVKAVTSDDEGRLLNMVDIETASDSACKHLAQKCAQSGARVQIPPQVPSDAFRYSTHSIQVGGTEKVWITSSDSVAHFYCQLDRNSHLFDKLTKDVAQLLDKPPRADRPAGLNCVCLARYTDHQWYRGQVVETSPNLKVHFVDYGDTLTVNESDVRPLPSEASVALSVAVQAVPLGLCRVPAEVPREVNQWFADYTLGQRFTMSVVAKGEKGKLMVELFSGSLNINATVRERTAKMKQHQPPGLVQQTDQQLSNSSGEHCSTREPRRGSCTKMTGQSEVHSGNRARAGDESTASVCAPEPGRVRTLGGEPTLGVALKDQETVAEASSQSSHSDSGHHALPSGPDGNVNVGVYKRPNINPNQTEEVYASSIAGPHYFWCQYANTENLNTVSKLAQEAAQAQQDVILGDTLMPGSPCLAVFSTDNQFHRAQVIGKAGDTLHVLFVDYGNESEVDVNNVRPLPQSLLETAPQAFLCSLNGFQESRGSWDDEVYDDFYNLLVDQPLKVTAFTAEDHSEVPVPQHTVKVECDEVVVNSLMQKYWKPSTAGHSNDKVSYPQAIQTEGDLTHPDVSRGRDDAPAYRKPQISKNTAEVIYASCIAEPLFFWCQYANTTDLRTVSQQAQDAGPAQQDTRFPETLAPGSPCLALFSSDNQWYRAQVVRRVDAALSVVFIDYGNESEVDIRDVRPLPQSLLDTAPQAFLCCLNGFDESEGSWDDAVYDDFYSLLVDKPLKLTVLSVKRHAEMAVPQHAVEVECEGVVVNALMEKYWKGVDKDGAEGLE